MKFTLILFFGCVSWAQAEYISVASLQTVNLTDSSAHKPIKFPRTLFNIELDSYLTALGKEQTALDYKSAGNFTTEVLELINVEVAFMGLKRHGDAYKFKLEDDETRVVATLDVHGVSIKFDALSMAKYNPESGTEFKRMKDGIIRARNMLVHLQYTGSNAAKDASQPCETKDIRLLGIDLTTPFQKVTGFPCKSDSFHPDCEMTHVIKDQVIPIALVKMSSLTLNQEVVAWMNKNPVQLCQYFGL